VFARDLRQTPAVAKNRKDDRRQATRIVADRADFHGSNSSSSA
jgi:hypothetical protein